MTRFVILGPPVGKGRPRARKRGKFIGIHSDPDSETWEASAGSQMHRQWVADADGQPLDDPVYVGVLAVVARPKRLTRKKDPDGRIPRTTKPDIDNVIKSCLDAMVWGGVLRDDSLVVHVEGLSLYAARDEGPRVEVYLLPISEGVAAEPRLWCIPLWGQDT